MLLCRTLKAIIILTMPPLFISQLRKIILFAALIVAIQGPATNIISNFQSVSIGLELRQEANLKMRQMAYEKAVELLHNITQPLKEMNTTLREFENSITSLWVAKKDFVSKIKGHFLGICENSLSPYYKCINFMDEAITGCRQRTFELLCKPVVAAKKGTSNGKLEYQHDFNAKTEFKFSIKPLKQELQSYSDKIFGWLDIVTIVLGYITYILLALAFIKAVKFAYKYNKRLDTETNYIYDEEMFKAADILNEPVHGFTVLPLNETERKEFVTFTSFKLAGKKEKGSFKTIFLTFIFLIPTIILIVIDCGSYFVFFKGYEFIHSNETQLPKIDFYKLNVSGNGFISELMRSILASFQPMSEKTDEFIYQVKQCVQEPNPPAYASILWIAGFVLIGFMLCFISPYVQRIEHLIARHYWPNRYQHRQHHLYELILTKRAKVLLIEEGTKL
uniref:Dendritic cell-specific transmembrane protein-like domain-containing protein n=1 Tax=Acrobeloides nanus TaxID=290746 RepID=A0A914C335_9BILA